MSLDTETLIDAVAAGEMTDPGGMTTTRDVVDAVPYSYGAVARALLTLEEEGAIENKTFGGDHVWFVPDDHEGSDETTSDRAIPTRTRAN